MNLKFLSQAFLKVPQSNNFVSIDKHRYIDKPLEIIFCEEISK